MYYTKNVFPVFLVWVFTLLALTSRAQSDEFVFTPQWTAQAQFAGYYVAESKGFFREAGINVRIEHPSATQPAMSRLRNNQCQATTLQLCQAMEIVDEGMPLVNILQTSMNNGMVIVSSRGKDPLTQKGARVGIWSVGFGQLAICMSIKDGLDYEWVRFAQNVNLFVNVQEDGVYMRRDYYEKHRDQAEKFAKACRKGWEWAAKHPEETLDIVMQYVQKNRIATNRVMQKLMLREVLRLQVDRESKKREFRLRPDMVRQASMLMLENRMLEHEVTYEQLINR